MSDIRELAPEPRELKVLWFEHTSVVPTDYLQYRTDLIRHKRRKRNRAIRGIELIALGSLILNAFQAVVVYVLQAGPI